MAGIVGYFWVGLFKWDLPHTTGPDSDEYILQTLLPPVFSYAPGPVFDRDRNRDPVVAQLYRGSVLGPP